MAHCFSRRDILHIGICVSGVVAGCTANPGPGTTTGSSSPTEVSTESASPTDESISLAPGEYYETREGWSVSVKNVTVQNAFVKFGTAHHEPYYGDGTQFVIADVEVSGGNAPDPATLDISVTTDTHERSGLFYVAAETNEDDRRQREAFPVPASPPPTQGAIVWEPEEWESVKWLLPESILTTIANPPAFKLHGFEARDASGDEIEVTLTVENTGDGDGIFLAEAGDAEFSDQDEIRLEVAAGEKVTETRRVSASFGDSDQMTVVLRWRDTTLERTIQKS